MPKPIKRHSSLQPLSRDHHHGLLFCWKIRAGIKRHIEIERLKNHIIWFWNTHLIAHFSEEEEVVFPILEADHPLVQKALEDHKQLKSLFNADSFSAHSLDELQRKLEEHIRFEERILFNEIQEQASPEQLKLVETHNESGGEEGEYEDDYWTWDKGN
jgi:iron-sulfur cluster repair protein YtfE (RIC family)